MKRYQSILEKLCSPSLRALGEGEFGVPLPTYLAPPEWYGFPPALLPIWSDGSGPNYLGVWKHWFTARPQSFVKTFVGSGHLTVEIARTERQLFAYIAIRAITINDGITPQLQFFADQVGLPNLRDLDEATVETGDDPQGFRNLTDFAVSTPLESANIESYDGSFPIPNADSFSATSPFEFKEELFATIPKQPDWLSHDIDKRSLFESYLADENLEAAWFVLNSSGWSYRDAASCGRSLAAKSTDALFKAIIETWSALAENDSGGY